MKVTILIFLFFFSAFSAFAATPKKLVKILERSIKAVDRVEMLEGDLFVQYGSLTPGDHSLIADLQDRFVLQRQPKDSLCGFWFREDCRDLLDLTKRFISCYDGENLITGSVGKFKKEDRSIAKSCFVNKVFNGLFDIPRSYWQKVTWSDSLFNLQGDTNWIGEITLLKDTVIDGSACYLVRNYKEGHRPKFHVTTFTEDLLAIDRSSFLPVWTRKRFIRAVKGEIQTDQTTSYRLAAFQVNRKLDERIFTSRDLKLTEQPETEVAEIKEGDLIPDWKITTLGGKEFNKAGQEGKVYILAFGYAGCGACNMAMPEFKAVCEKYKGHVEVKVFYLNGVDGEEYFRKYAKEKGLACELSVITPECAASLGVRGYPRYYVVDRRGRVVKNILGYAENRKLGQELERAVSAAL